MIFDELPRRIGNAAAGARTRSDALLLRFLDDAASKRPARGLFDQREFDLQASDPRFGLRRHAAETVTVEEPRLPPVGNAPPRPDPPDDPEFEVVPIPGTDEAIFVPKYTFRLVDPNTGKVWGGRWREGESFKDVDRNRNKKPDSMEPGNVGGMNPNDLWILLERIW